MPWNETKPNQTKPNQTKTKRRRCPRGVMVKAMDCGIAVNEFERQSRYNIHFRTNTFGKSMKPLILPAIG